MTPERPARIDASPPLVVGGVFSSMIFGVLAVHLVLVVRTAWVSDDAFITLRTVHNFVDGYGLRWNVAERVQSYTHPLWMLLLSSVFAVLRDPYFTAIALGLSTSTLALLGLVKLARSATSIIAGVLWLTLSRSYVDYSTSGLENPLLHLLIALFAWLYLVRDAGLRPLTLVAALIATTRFDALLVTLPALLEVVALTWRTAGFRSMAREVAVGSVPFVAWEAFSLIYYGFPFPNTAYAKLNTGVPQADLVVQGFVYLLNTLGWDPATIAGLVAGFGVAFSSRESRHKLLAAGAFLYILYILKVGGDFMAGRFLTLPLFLLLCVFVRAEELADGPKLWYATLPLLLLIVLPQAAEPLKVVNDWTITGVGDERMHYKESTGLMMFTRDKPLPDHRWVREGLGYKAHEVHVIGGAGFRGYYAHRKAHLVDIYALNDPLLARLPVSKWRVGHNTRAVPEGYVETLRTRQCKMVEPGLCEYYEKVRRVVSGKLWSWKRWKAITELNLWNRRFELPTAPSVSP